MKRHPPTHTPHLRLGSMKRVQAEGTPDAFEVRAGARVEVRVRPSPFEVAREGPNPSPDPSPNPNPNPSPDPNPKQRAREERGPAAYRVRSPALLGASGGQLRMLVQVLPLPTHPQP